MNMRYLRGLLGVVAVITLVAWGLSMASQHAHRLVIIAPSTLETAAADATQAAVATSSDTISTTSGR